MQNYVEFGVILQPSLQENQSLESLKVNLKMGLQRFEF